MTRLEEIALNRSRSIYDGRAVDIVNSLDLDYLLARIEALTKALLHTRAELARWGWGDFHYGDQPQERSVVDAIAVADKALKAVQ